MSAFTCEHYVALIPKDGRGCSGKSKCPHQYCIRTMMTCDATAMVAAQMYALHHDTLYCTELDA